jgi:hypothetical protein
MQSCRSRLISRTRIDVVSGLVDKALGAARAGTKKKGAELCAMYVEVENTGEGVIVSDLMNVRAKHRRKSWSDSIPNSQRLWLGQYPV